MVKAYEKFEKICVKLPMHLKESLQKRRKKYFYECKNPTNYFFFTELVHLGLFYIQYCH